MKIHLKNINSRGGGKIGTIKHSQTPSTATLIPLKEKSVNWDNTENLYIEGDNEETLKLLQKTYFGKVNIIYIDPPYNTGHDFVYKDDFKNSIENYKKITSQQSRANVDTSGRYHTDWLNMMFSRLLLANNLLSKDGIILISIDDNEVTNLRKICDEIFGENSFIAQIVWTNKEGGGGSDSKLFKIKHEYVLVYGKLIENLELRGDEVDNEERYTETDQYVNTRGKHLLIRLESGSLGYIPSLDFPIEGPEGPILPNTDGRKVKRWRWSKPKVEWGLKNDYIVFKKGQDGLWGVYTKQYLNADNEGNIIKRTKTPNALIDKYSTTQSAKELQKLFDGKIFDYPKPLDFIKYFINLIPSNDFMVLDFFSGSATTAHAVMQLNAEDNGKRKFIMVQLPEKCPENSEAYKRGYNTICDVGEERIRRAEKQIYDELKEKYDNAGPLVNDYVNPDNLDFGFKVFKLESTNIKPWDGSTKVDESTILNLEDTIKEDRTNLDVAYEIMLKYGIFNMPLKEVQINNKTMYSIGEGYMIICLNNDITLDDVSEIAKKKPNCIVFKEQGFKDDNEKINATYTLERMGVEEVKCI